MCSHLIKRKVEFLKKSILPLTITVILFTVFLCFYKVIYAINDDLMIESVLSGSFFEIYPYTYYFSVPLGTVIAALYTWVDTVPWFGVFIMSCYFVSIFSIEYVAINRVSEFKQKLLAVGASLIFIMSILLSGMILPHYTVVAATVGAVGIVLFMSSKCEQQFVAPIVFFIFTYLIRENVFFMLVPFVGIAFIYLLIVNKGCNIKGYFKYALWFFAASVVVIVVNRTLLSSDEWKQYIRFNDIRTEVYDYVGIIDDEEARDYYANHGISAEEINLIKSYNLLLMDKEKAENDLEIIADFAHMRLDRIGGGSRIREAVKSYIYRTLKERADFPYNYLVIGLYIVTACMILVNKKYFYFIPLAMTGIYRSAIWIYLIYKGRYPERVTVSLYIMEISLLLFMFIRSMHNSSKIIVRIALIGVIAAFILSGYVNYKHLDLEYAKVKNTNSCDDVLYSYMYDHLEDFYYLDVYATVSRTKPVLEKSEFDTENYMILGGWMLEHPLCNSKIAVSGHDTVTEALKSDSRYHIVVKNGVGADAKQLSEWIGADAIYEDSIDSGNVTFYIYSFCE